MRSIVTLPRCLRCRLRQDICICSVLPRIQTKTRVLVVMHVLEENKTTNTGRLAHLALPNSDIYYHGKQGTKRQLSNLFSRDGSTFLLYPDDSATEINSKFLSDPDTPITLVVPDGNWKQTRKMSHNIPDLAVLPRVRVPIVGKSNYKLRRAPRNGMLCTIEAIALALEHLEGKEVREKLEDILDQLNLRILTTRGRKYSGKSALTTAASAVRI